jgi:hypothetical protein
MRQIGTTLAKPGSQVLHQPRAEGALVPLTLNDPLPRISNPLADVGIPELVWSAFTPSHGPRMLRRPLTDAERNAVTARRDELAVALVPFSEPQMDIVLLALADMFGSFRSVRHTGAEALAVMESASRALTDFPCWAIQKVCRSIQQNGVWRDGKFDRQWGPNDSEIVDAVRKEIAFFQARHRSAAALLDAEVED